MEYNPAKIQTKNYQLSKKATWTRWVICGLLLVTASADFFTFVIEAKFRIFDMSLLTIWTNNILIIFLVKFAVIGGLIYLLVGVKQASDYWRYLWLLMGVYLILFLSCWYFIKSSSCRIKPTNRICTISWSKGAKTGINFALIWGYFPIGFSMLSFWLWNWGWRKS